MEDEAVSTFGDEGSAGVGILTTLASSRRGRPGPVQIEGLPVNKNVWPMRALIGLMGVGVVSLLTGFVMVLMDGRAPDAAHATDAAQATNKVANVASPTGATQARAAGTGSPAEQAPGDNPLAALIAPPQHGGLGTPPAQAAVIENVIATPAAASVLPSAGTSIRAIQTEPAAATQVAMATPHQDPAKAAARPTLAGTPVATSAVAPTTAFATPSAIPAARPGTPAASPSSRRNTSRQDDDVALLEAMFAHTRARPASPSTAPFAAPSAGPSAAPSVADELKHCSSLAGAAAATCRARVCVQNPAAAACHQDP